VARLANLQEVNVLRAVKGERWIVGDQDWPMAYQSWTDTWYQVEGGYIYSAFVFIPKAGEASPFIRTTDRWIEVDLKTQTLRALVGDRPIFFAAVTTGKDGYETPPGRYTVGNWRVANETMTSGQAAISDPAEAYHVKNVLYTQYFDTLGDALHLNYWQPESVFGAVRTSHGCVGLYLHDAQWLWFFTQGGVRLEIR
jgi:lipoprotein-anchoring transpeptidase ErfK/SrfK